MTGGWLKYQAEKTALTEMSVNNGRWVIVSSASLPAPLVSPAALTINNQVYLFGNFSKPQKFSLKFLNAMICRRRIRQRRTDPNPEVRQLPEFLDWGRSNEKPTFWTCRPGSARCQQVLSTNTITISYTASITSTTTCLPFLGFLFCYKRKINFFIPTSKSL